jgi:hypothetical protein
MSTKRELVASILKEMGLLQDQGTADPHPRKTFSFPPMLPAREGRIILVSQKILDDVARYADTLTGNSAALAHAYTNKDLRTLVRRAFGYGLTGIDLDDPLDANVETLFAAVESWLATSISEARLEQTFTFGSWVFSGGQAVALEIGPVSIEDRNTWLHHAGERGRVSRTTSARLARNWAGQPLRRRKPSLDQDAERAIIASLGDCPVVTSVTTSDLAGGAAEEKALRAARLAHTAVALLWETPSSVLGRMGLLFDGGMIKRHYVVLANDANYGSSSSISRMSGGASMPDNWQDVWSESNWFIKPIGDALTLHLKPPSTVNQPRMLTALLLSLWWFHAACEEKSPLFAIVKFAASMDALANGKRRIGITNLIDSRRGVKAGTPLFVNGRTTYDVIGEIYDTARSRAIHGTLEGVGHDWTETRTRAEMMARLCLRFTCGWMTDHPGRDDLDALRHP